MSKQSRRRRIAKMIRAASDEKMIQFSADSLEWIKATDGDATKPKRFSMLAYTGGAMRVGYYGSPVVIDLAGLTAAAPLPILLDHDTSQIVGHADEVDVKAASVSLTGVISGGGEEAAQVIASAGLGFPWKASVGASPDKMEFVGEGISTIVNGKTFKGPLYVARKSTLGEVSFVALAADQKTSAKVAAKAAHSLERNKKMDKFHEWLQAKGFDPAELTEKQTACLKAAYDDEQAPVPEPTPEPTPPPTPEPTPAERIRAEAAAEANRISAIHALCVKHPAIEAEAIGKNWTPNQTEIAVLKAEIPKAPAIHGSTRDVAPKAIEAAFCMAGGLREIEKHYQPDVLEAASLYQRHEGASLQGLILASARDNGYTGSAGRIHRGNYDEVMRSVLGGMIRASAPSTHSLTTMLSTVGNKFLLDGFSSVEQVWREFSSIRPVNDFKAITSYRMLDNMVFEEVGPAGEIKHGTASQETYTNQAKTYAKMFSLTRQDIINDDLGAFDTIRSRIGRGSGIKLNQVFWATFLDDAVLFNATAETESGGHNNLLTAVLGETGIAAANVLLKSKTDGYGNPIDIGGAHLLLTGATLAPTAKKWYVSQEIRDTTATTKTPTTNIYYNTFRPVESRYVTSTTAWYLLPIGGGDMSPMEVCFLDGVQSPTIESADADFDTLGIQFRGYFDFGVAQKEWRASVKSTGAG